MERERISRKGWVTIILGSLLSLSLVSYITNNDSNSSTAEIERSIINNQVTVNAIYNEVADIKNTTRSLKQTATAISATTNAIYDMVAADSIKPTPTNTPHPLGKTAQVILSDSRTAISLGTPYADIKATINTFRTELSSAIEAEREIPTPTPTLTDTTED